MTLRTGKSAIGTSAVAGMGMASVIHQVAMRIVTAAALKPDGGGQNKMPAN